MSTTETPTPTEQDLEPMLEFKFPTNGTEQVDARTLVRWCSHRRLLTALEKASFKDPRLVIVVRGPREIHDGHYSDAEWEDTAVYCVPLTAEMHHLYFHRPGGNEVRAFVVEYDSKEIREWVREAVKAPRIRLSGTQSMFQSLYDSQGKLRWRQMPDEDKYFATDALETVEVPAGLFAPPPSGWRKRFVARYYKGKPYDECDFRSQVIGSVAKAVFFSTIGTVLRLLSLLVGLVFGVRDIDWKAVVRPLEPRIGVLTNTTPGNNLWWTDKHGNLRFSPLNLINPLVLGITPNALYGISRLHSQVTHHKHTYSVPWVRTGYWQCVAWVDGVIVGVAIAVTLVALLVIGAIWLAGAVANNERLGKSRIAKLTGSKLEGLVESRKEARERRDKDAAVQEAQQLRRIQVAVAAMTCEISSDQVSIAALPKEKRTVRLRASQAKVALCRPFAR